MQIIPDSSRSTAKFNWTQSNFDRLTFLAAPNGTQTATMRLTGSHCISRFNCQRLEIRKYFEPSAERLVSLGHTGGSWLARISTVIRIIRLIPNNDRFYSRSCYWNNVQALRDSVSSYYSNVCECFAMVLYFS